MPKIEYITKDFRPASLLTITQANEIIEEYAGKGLDLTLRQLYYQFVSRDLIANKQTEYKKLGSLISDARLAGLIDWDAIVDRTRNVKGNSHWSNPGEIIRSARYSFQLDHWENQEYYVEVWIEKEALIGVISSICSELDVRFFACKGYVSQSEMWRAAMRLKRAKDAGQKPVIIHLGDHDPSGMDMTRDIFDRCDLFTGDIEVKRIALNMDQINKYNPPPNPAKLTDTRAGKYIDEYGAESWELDALDPEVLRDLIQEHVDTLRDWDLYQETLDQEQEYKDILENVEKNWKTL